MRTFSAQHRIYLLYRQSRAEESMISFIRDKLIRKGCLVVQDVTQSTTVLVLLTPGVFEFIDDSTDKVCSELLYVLRRCDKFRVHAILCDLFMWPDSIHLPEEIRVLQSWESIEWSPDNRNAFMRCLFELIDPSLLDVMSRPTSPQIILEEDETSWNGGKGRNGVSTRAQNIEEVDGGRKRSGSAFYFDELNAHVERKSEVTVGRKLRSKISEFPALSTANDEGRLEETSDDTDIEGSYTMEAYRPPELPDNAGSPANPGSDPHAYRPPEPPRGASFSSPGSDDSEHAIASHEVPIFNGDEPDSYGVSLRRRERADSYEPPELPLDENHGEITVEHTRQTPAPSSRTATIRPRSGDKTSIYVPPPTPPPLINPENGRDEIDLNAKSPPSSRGSEPRGGTTTGVLNQGDTESENFLRPDRGLRPEPGRRPHSQPLPRSELERGVDASVPNQVFMRTNRSTGLSTSSRKRNGAPVEKRSAIGKLFRRKSFTLPKDSEIRYGRYADEHPYWNAGAYRKLNLMDEFCDESYFANKRNTFPRTSVRRSNRRSSPLEYSEPEYPNDVRARRAPSVVVLEETDIRRYVPEVEMISDETTEDLEARRKDAGSTPKSERKTYDAAEEYRPPAEPMVIEVPVDAHVNQDERPVAAPRRYYASEPHKPTEEPAVAKTRPPTYVAEVYAPAEAPQLVQEPLATGENSSTYDFEKYSPAEEPEPMEEITFESIKATETLPEYSPPPYDDDVQIVPDYVVLPPPRKHIFVNHAQVAREVALEEVKPIPEQPTYAQQLILPRRFPPLSKASEVQTTVPDIRMAAGWTQVGNLHSRYPSAQKETAVGEYRPPPLPMESDPKAPQETLDTLESSRRSREAETLKTVPAAIRRYKPPEPAVESSKKSEPIAYWEPIHRELTPEIQLRAEPCADYAPRADFESKLEPIAHREAQQVSPSNPEAVGTNEPPPLPHETASSVARNGQNTVIRQSEPIAFRKEDVTGRMIISEQMPQFVTRRNEPVQGNVATTTDSPYGASFSKQTTITEPLAHTRMDRSSGSTVVESTRLARPIIFRQSVHPGDELPLTPPNSFSETTIHDSIGRAQTLTPRFPAVERDPAPTEPTYRQPAIPQEFSKSLISPDDSYTPPALPPPIPTAPMPEEIPVRNESDRILEERRKAAPVAHRIRPEVTAPPSKITETTYYQPPPVPSNDEIEDKDKRRPPVVERKAQSVADERAPRSKQTPVYVPPRASVHVAPQESVYVAPQEPVYVAPQESVYVAPQEPVYVPPQVPKVDDEYNERKGSPVAYIRPPQPYKQNVSNDGDDEEEEDLKVRTVNLERQKVVKNPEFRLREREPVAPDHDLSGRRSRSVIEVSQSTMEPIMRRRVNSLDPRLTRDLREYVERHVCNKSCCKVVCPRRLAENIDNLHYSDDVRILTNLDVLGRRRLSYLLAVEAQRYVSYLDSKFISAAGAAERSKTPDSGCDPSSKISDGDSDATLSEGELASEEAVARELAKIAKIRRRNGGFQEYKVLPPPRGFDGLDRHQIYASAEGRTNTPESSQPYQAPLIPSEQRAYQPPELPSTSAGPIPAPRRNSKSSGAQVSYRKPQTPMGNDEANSVAYREPAIPSGYESPTGLPSNPAAREAMKNIIEGRTVFEPHIRNTKSSHEQRESDAKEAYNTWQSIWRNVEREEVPALTGHEILSLFGVMRHILGTKSSLQEVRDDLRTMIRKNGMGLKR